LHPLEVREHIKKTFDINSDILNLVFGSINREGQGESNGYTIFFMNNLLVTPNRFRPPTSGISKGGDRSFLHAHSAMLTRVLNAKIAFSEAIASKIKGKSVVLDHNMEVSEV